MTLPLLPTTVVGSYPQPGWLIDRDKLLGKLPPRHRPLSRGCRHGARNASGRPA